MLIGGNVQVGSTPVKIINAADFSGGSYTVVLRVDTISDSVEVHLGHETMSAPTGGLVLLGGDTPLTLTIPGEDLYAVSDNVGDTRLSFLAYSC